MAAACGPASTKGRAGFAAASDARVTGPEVHKVGGMVSIDAYADFSLGLCSYSLRLGNSNSCGCAWAVNSGGKERCHLGTSLQSKTGRNTFPENTT